MELRKRVEDKFASRLNKLKSQTTDNLQALDLPPEYAKPLNALTEKVNAGKEEQPKAAMEMMAKYKKKYTPVSSIRELRTPCRSNEATLPTLSPSATPLATATTAPPPPRSR